MNPFEIRLELLKLAYQIENERTMSERIRVENDWHTTKEKYSSLSPPPFPHILPVSVDDVVKTASALNAFVSTKDN